MSVVKRWGSGMVLGDPWVPGDGNQNITGDLTVSGQMFIADGSVTDPSIALASDTDTGIYGAASQIRVAVAGGNSARFLSDSLRVYGDCRPNGHNNADLGVLGVAWKDLHLAGDANIGGQIFIADGTVANPALALTSSTNTGVYALAANNLSFAASGVGMMSIDAAKIITKELRAWTHNTFDIGTTAAAYKDFHQAGAHLMTEMTAPSGTANVATIFAQDNGSGKTQLMVIFGSGAAQQIAIEP